ncbi:MAG: transketolase family protein [Chlorobi bacterium]|nr:transketolase family protein [Chlorobiota bacterium]MCI0717346.1 transketolase family protein [Chlorobiota bacterium]
MNFIHKTVSCLVENLDLKNPELKETRKGFGEALIELGKTNPDVVVLGGDVSGSVRSDMFRDVFPDRFFSVGVSEQDMMGTAAGLSVVGKIPFASTYGEFATGRPFDQIRQSIAYSEMNVKICASHCGLTVGPDGATHQSLEDVAIMRVLPHMYVITPCDYNQTYRAVIECTKIYAPFYIRFYRDNSPNFTNPKAPFEFGKADTLLNGDDCTIIASGLCVWESLLAAEELAKEKISIRLINMHTIKPFDTDAVVKAAKETGCIVTVEDHQKKGGLGGAVAEALAQEYPSPVEFVGASDTFGESGKGSELFEKYGISKRYIVEAVKRAIKRKK